MSIGGTIEKLLAGRWIAGAGIRDAISTTKRFNKERISASINYLGENFSDKAEVDRTVGVYAKLIEEIHGSNVDAAISVKPTQLGLLIGKGYAKRNYSRIVRLARKKGIFVWLDMEEHQYVDDTISLYRSQQRRRGTGICIQAYLRRSDDDVKRLVKAGAVIRLVKGAYKEGESIAYPTRKAVTANYLRLMSYLFRNSDEFMIATHDTDMIREALLLNRSYRRKVSYAMLNGIRNKYLVELAKMGNKTVVYIPFGERWFDYSVRRLREEGHLTLILRSLFQSQKL